MAISQRSLSAHSNFSNTFSYEFDKNVLPYAQLNVMDRSYASVHCSYGFYLLSIQEDNRLWFDLLLFLLYCFNFLAYRRSDHENLIGFNF